MNIYFAAPLFAKSDLLYNAKLVEEIRSLSNELTIYLPQENEA
ncbi:TPA: nucleoside 2-deoxyribosyltransferase, partial [Enterococcus hirae]